MRFELIGKTKATLQSIEILSLKMGQTDTKPAVALSFKVTRSNDALNMLDPALRPLLFTKGNPNKADQATLDGVQPVSDLNQLTDVAQRMGTIAWDDEQTGSALVLYHGIGKKPKMILRDATLKKLKFDNLEGGAVDFFFQVHSADVDAEVIGELGVLKSHDIDIEFTAPELVTQKQIGDDDKPKGGVQTPEQALAAHLGHTH